ncbi:MAG TPA: cell envelope integrity protein TolA [Psychromonas sp.]
MNIRSSFFLLFLTLFLFVSSRSHALNSQGAYVYKVNPGSPSVYPDKFKVSTITRGAAANQPFKVLLQTVPKAVFLTAFRRAISLTPYGIGMLAAYEAYNYYYDDSTGDLMVTGSRTIPLSTPASKWSVKNPWGGVSSSGGTYQNFIDSIRARKPALESTLQPVFNADGNLYQMSSDTIDSEHASFTFLYPQSPDFGLTADSIVDDTELFTKVGDYISANPELNHNDMFNDEYGNVIPEMFPNPEYVEFTQADLDLIGLYEAGLMQSEDPNAPNYYTAETIAKAKALSETKAAQDARTAEDEAKKLTEDEKLPITQAQHKTNQLEAEARADEKAMADLGGADTTELDKNEKLDESFDLLDGLMNNLSGLPVGLPAIPIFEYSSNCQTISIAADVPEFGMVGSVAFPSPEQCIKILNPIKDMLGWLLYISVSFLMLFQLYKEVH